MRTDEGVWEARVPHGGGRAPAARPQVDQRVFRDLMSEKLPRLHAHLEQHRVDYTLITFNWFLVVFVDSVVSDVLFKIWDSFLYEGPKVRLGPARSSLVRETAHLLPAPSRSPHLKKGGRLPGTVEHVGVGPSDDSAGEGDRETE